MVDTKRRWKRNSYILILIGLSLSAYYTIQRMYLEQQSFRRSLFEDFDDELENETVINNVMAQINAHVKALTRSKKYRREIESVNTAQTVFNDYLYTGLSDDNFVIVVRVHRASNHLRQMLSSLYKTYSCHKLFVILVHDCTDAQIKKLDINILHHKYMHFYYPYASEIFFNYYPGPDKHFCGADYKCIENDGRRNASLVEEKHLWWWTVHHVFNLEVMKNYTRYVIFVDERSYFTEDLVFLMRLMDKGVGVYCPNCMMINYGGSNHSVTQYHFHETPVTIEPFGLDFASGIAFNRTMWTKMKELKNLYCLHNDYSWIESMKNLFKSAPEQFLVLSCVGPRVIDTSMCEATSHNITCNFDNVQRNITMFLNDVQRAFYPDNIYLTPKDLAAMEVLQRGGWEDIRDRDMCLYLASKQKLNA